LVVSAIRRRASVKNKSVWMLLFSFVCFLNTGAQRFSFIKNKEGVLLTDSGKKVFFYQSKTKSLKGLWGRANYIHPLYGFDGEILTEDFPEDHLHHRGIFWAWHQVFVNNFRVGDGWECKRIGWEPRKIKTTSSDTSARLLIHCYWTSDSLNGKAGKRMPFLKEETIVEYKNNGEGTRTIQFLIKLTALKDTVKLGGSEDEKQYSGFSVRFKLPADIRFYSNGKEIIPLQNGNEAGSIVSMKGSFGNSKTSSVEMELDSLLPPKKQKWILRKEKSMQNIAFPGNSNLIVIAPGRFILLKYKIHLRQGGL
jgi:Methane oxygenase PmoA